MSTFPAHLDFDDDEDEAVVAPPRATVTARAPRARATVGSRAPRETRASDRLSRGRGWGPTELRDYVLRMIGETSGAHVTRDPKIEHGIFTGFINRWGSAKSEAIARWAFETQPTPGMWLNAPIRPGRFTKGADEVFASVIASRL